MSDETTSDKNVAFADDLTPVGKFDAVRKWWNKLIRLGSNYGYNPQPPNYWLITAICKVLYLHCYSVISVIK